MQLHGDDHPLIDKIHLVGQLRKSVHIRSSVSFCNNYLPLLENYVSFTNRYQSEQTEIQGKIVVLNTKLEQQVDYQAAAEQLRAAISDYLNIENLTPLILNKLIEKIQVSHVEKVDGQLVQEITIMWRFAGNLL